MTHTSTSNPPPELFNTTLLIEDELNVRLQALPLPPHLSDAAKYAVVHGGKRVRPILTLMCCQAVGGTQQQAMPAAIAVEFIHCFSLVHDDLPSMDNDELRRGKPTLHIYAGEAMALLAGDLLLPLAFSQLSDAQYPPLQQTKLTDLLATATRDMVIGQVYDTLGGLPEHLDQKARIEEIHRKKTGTLIQCASQMGAICGNASDDAFEAITTFGQAIGLMFQIIDDLIDLHGSQEHVGKATRKDEKAGKTTYPNTIGVDASRRTVSELQEQADEALRTLGDSANTLRSFNVWMAHRTR